MEPASPVSPAAACGPDEADSKRTEAFFSRGWCRFSHDDALASWLTQILPVARAAVTATENAEWLHCGGTWFVGVNSLPNGPDGAVPGGTPIAGHAVEFVRHALGMTEFGWDKGQVSVVYRGYPKRMESETRAAFRYRRERDAAHIDGVLRDGPDKRRYLRMYHEFILGIPVDAVSSATSPLVVWEGSHELVRQAFRARFGELPASSWPDEDVTDTYNAVRRRIFASCKRIEITAKPGEAYLLHRLTLHGIAPWSASEPEAAESRMIVYFRPNTGSPETWLDAP